MINKMLSFLGLAKKAGKIALGYENTLDSIHKGRAYAVFTASDVSEKTRRGLEIACDGTDVKMKILNITMFELSGAVGQKTGIVSINDSGFAKKLLEMESNLH